MIRTLTAVLALIAAAPAAAEVSPRMPDRTLQAEKLEAFSMLIGRWAGEGWIYTREGKSEFIQTEEVAPMLSGTILSIYGAGRDKTAADNAAPAFEAFGIISFDETRDAYFMRSYANGYVGDFEITPRANGFAWSPGPVRYEAVVENGVWAQKGYRTSPDGKEVQFFDMTVRRVGD